MTSATPTDEGPVRGMVMVHMPGEAALAAELGASLRRMGVEPVRFHPTDRLPIADPLSALLAVLARQASLVVVVVPSQHRNLDWLVRELDMQNRMHAGDPSTARFVALVTGSQRTWRMLLSNVVLELRRADELERVAEALASRL